MRSQKLRIKISLFIIVFLSAATLMAQQKKDIYKNDPSNNERNGCILYIRDLTEDQIDKIEELRFDHRKEMLSYRTKLQENRAKMNTLQIQEPVNMDAINKLIDESEIIRTDMLKNKVAHQQQIRSLLTEEQRVIFDEHMIRPDKIGRGRYRGIGYGYGYGNGYGSGRYRYNCPLNNNLPK